MEEKKPDTLAENDDKVVEEEVKKIEEKSKEKGTLLQLILFIALSIIACVVQMLIINYLPKLIKNDTVVDAWIFTQPLNSLIGFLVGNVVAKLLSYFLNRKATFGARKHFAFSMTVYVIMCVILIVVETLIGEPLKQEYVKLLGDAMSKVPFLASDVEGWCNILSIITYSCADLIIVFIMNKFVIMNDHIFDRWEKKTDEETVAVAADESAEAPAVEAPVEEVAASDAVEAPVEEAVATEAVEAPVEETAASEEAAEAEAVEEVAEAVEVATPVEEVVTEEPLAETAAEEEAVGQAEQTASDEAPAEIAEAPAEEAAAEQPEVAEAAAEEAVVEEQAPAEEVAAAPAEEKPAKKAPAKKAAAKKTDDKKPAAKKPAAKKADDKKAPAKKAPAKKADAKEEKESAPANVTVLFEEPDTDSPKGKFVVIKDDLNPDRPYKFQLKANNGQVLYESESFKIKPRAKQIEVFRNTINNGTSTIDSEKNGTFRYKLFKADGTLYGVGEGYKTRASAESALESVKNFCNTSNVLEDTTVD